MRITFLLLLIYCVLDSFSFTNYFERGTEAFKNTKYDSSLYYFNIVLQSENYNDSLKTLALINRGKSYQLLHQYDSALVDFNKGLQLYQNKKNFNGIAFTHISKAEFFSSFNPI